MKNVKKWIWDGVKTAYRYAVIALLPELLDIGIAFIGALVVGIPDLSLGANEKWLLRFGLAAADKMLHEWKKKTGSEGKWKGIVGV